MIYTSNYSRMGSSPYAIAISAYPPKFFRGPHIKALAPPWKLVENYKAGHITEHQYAEQYFNHLLMLETSAQEIVESIPDNSILLCFESPFDFCHRRLLALWIENETTIKIPEWFDDKTKNVIEFYDKTLEY